MSYILGWFLIVSYILGWFLILWLVKWTFEIADIIVQIELIHWPLYSDDFFHCFNIVDIYFLLLLQDIWRAEEDWRWKYNFGVLQFHKSVAETVRLAKILWSRNRNLTFEVFFIGCTYQTHPRASTEMYVFRTYEGVINYCTMYINIRSAHLKIHKTLKRVVEMTMIIHHKK